MTDCHCEERDSLIVDETCTDSLSLRGAGSLAVNVITASLSLRGGQRPTKQSFENGSGQAQQSYQRCSGQTPQSHEIASLSLAMTGY